MNILPHHIQQFLDDHGVSLPPHFRYCNTQKRLLLSVESYGEGFYFDWNETLRELKRGEGRAPRGPLFKALGKGASAVVDATCGAGKDSLMMALWGLEVCCFERCLDIFLLQLDAFQRLEDEEIKSSLTLNFGEVGDNASGKIVYYDPMYPHTRGKRLPQKNMQVLSSVVGEDGDADDFIGAVLSKKVQKLIVKRPLRAPEGKNKQSHSHHGKTARYDVYLFAD